MIISQYILYPQYESWTRASCFTEYYGLLFIIFCGCNFYSLCNIFLDIKRSRNISQCPIKSQVGAVFPACPSWQSEKNIPTWIQFLHITTHYFARHNLSHGVIYCLWCDWLCTWHKCYFGKLCSQYLWLGSRYLKISFC